MNELLACHNNEDLNYNPIDRNTPNVILISSGENVVYCFLPDEIYQWVVLQGNRNNPYTRAVISDEKINEIIEAYNQVHPEAVERDRVLQRNIRPQNDNNLLERQDDFFRRMNPIVIPDNLVDQYEAGMIPLTPPSPVFMDEEPIQPRQPASPIQYDPMDFDNDLINRNENYDYRPRRNMNRFHFSK